MAHVRQEGALGLVGLLGVQARLARLGVQPRVLQRGGHVGGDGGQQAFVATLKAPSRVVLCTLSTPTALPPSMIGTPRIGKRALADHGGAQRLSLAVELLVDQQGLACVSMILLVSPWPSGSVPSSSP